MAALNISTLTPYLVAKVQTGKGSTDTGPHRNFFDTNSCNTSYIPEI